MKPFFTAFRRAIAVIGLVAVVFGALEHEDLILQDGVGLLSSRQERALTVNDDAELAPLDAASSDRVAGESGTEGTFRSDVHRLLISPPVGGGSFVRPRKLFCVGEIPLRSWRQTAPLRPILVGVVILRL